MWPSQTLKGKQVETEKVVKREEGERFHRDEREETGVSKGKSRRPLSPT